VNASGLNAQTAKPVPVFPDARKTMRASLANRIDEALIARFACSLVAQ